MLPKIDDSNSNVAQNNSLKQVTDLIKVTEKKHNLMKVKLKFEKKSFYKLEYFLCFSSKKNQVDIICMNYKFLCLIK